MTRSRKQLISVADTPYYHCVSRCVRQAFLCGKDARTGKDYSHRRTWLVKRMAYMAKTFAIDVCAYAVMSNHYHLVLRVNPAIASRLTDRQVVKRWGRLYRIPPEMRSFIDGSDLPSSLKQQASRLLERWRGRLMDISWYMRALNEYLARRANAEDECKGRFWEGRFKSQALLDIQALLTCMAYVDLNPVRANLSKLPEMSAFTSIKQRVQASRVGRARTAAAACPLVAFASGSVGRKMAFMPLPFAYNDYLQLVDWCGRAVRSEKEGSIPANVPPILQRLGIRAIPFAKHMRGEGARFFCAQGHADVLRSLAGRWQQRLIKGVRCAAALFARTESIGDWAPS